MWVSLSLCCSIVVVFDMMLYVMAVEYGIRCYSACTSIGLIQLHGNSPLVISSSATLIHPPVTPPHDLVMSQYARTAEPLEAHVNI